MLFNSLSFFVFFPIVTALYFALDLKHRWKLLLAAGCVFYMAFVPRYILILFLLIAVDYVAGLRIEKSRGARRKAWLSASLCANIGILSLFKYFNFVNANLSALAEAIHWNYPVKHLALILPFGLSFHTFQSMAYTIEVYRGRIKAERHLGFYALYILFYPQLVAGPIERPQHLLPQLRKPKEFDWNAMTAGLKLMAVGLFKKMAIADRLAPLVNEVYMNLPANTGFWSVVAMYYFAIQVYCDFSGYSDIARGAARMMGIDLTENFRQPFFAKSLADHWTRWHISLMSWFRDYLYIPLGGNRVRKARWLFNIFLVFLISGLWHGANWTYIAFGSLHGALIILSILTAAPRAAVSKALGLDRMPRLSSFLAVLMTFHLVTFTYVFFRAASIHDAWFLITHLLDGWPEAIGELARNFRDFSDRLAPGALVALFAVMSFLCLRHDPWAWLARRKPWVRWSAYYVFLVTLVTLATQAHTIQNFVYFQF